MLVCKYWILPTYSQQKSGFSTGNTLEIPYNNELTLRNKNKGNDIQQGKRFLPLAWTQLAILKKYY